MCLKAIENLLSRKTTVNRTARLQQVGKARAHHSGAFVSCFINRLSITKLRIKAVALALLYCFYTLQYQVAKQLTASCPLTAVVAQLWSVSSSLVFAHNINTYVCCILICMSLVYKLRLHASKVSSTSKCFVTASR